MLINLVDATNDANHYTKPPPYVLYWVAIVNLSLKKMMMMMMMMTYYY